MVFLIKIYQYLKPIRTIALTSIGISPHSCRHNPSCSQYTKNAIKRYGTIQGSLLGVIKILKCNPFYKG